MCLRVCILYSEEFFWLKAPLCKFRWLSAYNRGTGSLETYQWHSWMVLCIVLLPSFSFFVDIPEIGIFSLSQTFLLRTYRSRFQSHGKISLWDLKSLSENSFPSAKEKPLPKFPQAPVHFHKMAGPPGKCVQGCWASPLAFLVTAALCLLSWRGQMICSSRS